MKFSLKHLVMALILFSGLMSTASVQAGHYRQYYGNWSYSPSHSYYYRTYYYKPVTTYPSYNYHYCIHYPSRPQYVYYYNPVKRYYWGRFDLQGKEGEQYSILKEEDRKEKFSDIPESAFPKPGKMPQIPEAQDGETVAPISPKDLPQTEENEELPKKE